MGLAVSNIFPTVAARLEVNALFGSVPESMMNLFGNAEKIGSKVGTLGGYVTFKYSVIFALGTAVWSILALSGTLAGEASRGSLDFVAVVPFGKRRIALEKLAAHLTLLWLAMAILAAVMTFSSNVFGDAALGDQIPLLSSIGFALWVGLLAMCFGGLAFALSPLLGRAGSAGVAGLAMAALWLANGMNVGGPLLILSPFNWTFDHIPLVGIYDWPSLALVGVVGVVLLFLTIMLSFSGYLLPWDQIAYWAITIGTNFGAYFPVVNTPTKYMLLGGLEVGQNTLLRFYVVHIMVLPLVAAVFLAVHFWRIRKDGGISGPL